MPVAGCHISRGKFIVTEGVPVKNENWTEDLYLYRIKPVPPKKDDLQEYISLYCAEKDDKYLNWFFHYYEPRLNTIIMQTVQENAMQGHFADLKQALLYFAKEMFGSETQIRLRPSYFPFTEPSAEMDISCNICGGKGCAFCKHTGWVEILGCGMVDPNVLEACGIDSKIYSGYALGMGIERVTNLKYKVKDLRMFSENDVRFLEEFESAH